MSQSKIGSVENEVNRRQYSRVEFDAQVTLMQDEASYDSELVDISLNGALVATPGKYQVRTDRPCELLVRLSADALIRMNVALIHSSSEFLGFQCISIDMDSIVVLRRLIEVNLNDSAAEERVLTELLMRQQNIQS